MATLQDYKDVAPTVMNTGDFTKSQVETKLASIPERPEPQPDPEITKAKVVAIFNTVFVECSVTEGVSRAGGFGQLAKENDLRPYQVKTIVKELGAMFAVFNKED